MRVHVVLGAVLGLCFCACIGAPESDPDESSAGGASPGVATEPVVKGPCATACAAILSGACDWQSQCSDGGWPEIAACGGLAIMCTTAEIAASEGGAYGLEYCYRDCENLR